MDSSDRGFKDKKMESILISYILKDPTMRYLLAPCGLGEGKFIPIIELKPFKTSTLTKRPPSKDVWYQKPRTYGFGRSKDPKLIYEGGRRIPRYGYKKDLNISDVIEQATCLFFDKLGIHAKFVRELEPDQISTN